jgi:hypothetical protein
MLPFTQKPTAIRRELYGTLLAFLNESRPNFVYCVI